MQRVSFDRVDFFLGATTPAGFKGYFEPLRREPGMQMVLIKSGPGCGKSTLMKQLARRAIQQISLPEAEKPQRDPVDLSKLKVGQQVFVNNLDSVGTVEDIGSKQLTVSVRGMTVRVKFKDVSAPYLDELNNRPKRKPLPPRRTGLSARPAWPRN